MSHGAGPYDPEAIELMQRLKADCVVLIVHGGSRGDGFEVCCIDPRLLKMLAAVLRGCAAAIEIDMAALQPESGRLDG